MRLYGAYDLYNTEDGKDNWNFENYSLLGPNRKPRNIDGVAHPYPMRSASEPILLFFDIDSKYAELLVSTTISDKKLIQHSNTLCY